MKVFSLKLPESLDVKLTATARKRKQTKSVIVRNALEAFIENDETVPRGSCLDLAAELVGCSEGPRDLATGKKYMRRYGQ